MPRPKRSKVAPSAPIQLPHLANPAIASAAQKQRDIFSPASSGRVTTTSDDSDGLVVSKKTGARGKGLKGQEYTMSGALAPEDIGSTRLKPPSNQTRAALSKIAREADYAKKVAESKARRNTDQPETATELDQVPSSIPTESLPTSKPSISGMGNSSAVKGAQMSLGSRISETPRPQPLMLGATFKKRARQPSLLQMLQTQNDPSDNLDDDDLDDFRPDDESTPMIKSMSQPNAQRTSSSSGQTSGSRKRKLASPEIQVPASQTCDPPSSPPTLPPQEQEDPYDLPAETEREGRPEPTLPQQRAAQTSQRQLDSDTLAPPQSSSPEKPKAREIHTKTAKAATRPQQQTRRRKQPSPAPSPLSSHASTIPNTNPSPPKFTIHSKPLTTATLQNLLPRRRARPKTTHRGEYDIPNSGSSDVELDNTALGEDEDELSFHATLKMRRKKKRNDPTTTTTAVKQQQQQKRAGKGKGKANANAKGKGKAKEAAPSSNKRISRTYTKKKDTIVQSDAENAPISEMENESDNDDRGGIREKTPALPENPHLNLDLKANDEMKRLAAKFREVDEYTLEFEEMTGNSSGQMRDAS